MQSVKRTGLKWRLPWGAPLAAVLLGLGVLGSGVLAQDKSAFPDGYDAVQAAPLSHKVIFENALVRVLQVSVPAPGTTEPMHHHRWPGFFLEWDTGGRTPHVRYHRGDGSVQDQPSRDAPAHPGRWSVQWMKPEPLHAVEGVESYPREGQPPLLRIEIKVSP